jgi:hypothetical protein
MELKVIKTGAISLNEALGISEERRIELSDKLDGIVQEILPKYPVYATDIYREIARICDSLEEYTYCMAINSIWKRLKQYSE